MAKKELHRASVLERVVSRITTCREAATQLGVSVRQVFRSLKRYREKGPTGLIHQGRGRESNRQMNGTVKAKITELLLTKYTDFGPTFASEKLDELDGIAVSREYVRLLMLKEGLWHKKRKRRKGRLWRPRKEHFGQLVQIDGSEHRWFFGIDQHFTLIAFIDDASSRLMYAALYSGESTECLMNSTKEYCLEHGKPLALYSDRGSVYKINTNNLNDDLCTQYEHALDMLDIELKHAYSPQAKGRVERLFGTLQDRLVKELKLANIVTVAEANAFIKNTFIPRFNERFSVSPARSENLHRSVLEAELDTALCIVSERVVSNDWTIRYDNIILQLDNTRPAIVKPRDHVLVHKELSGALYVTIRKETIEFREITKREKTQKPVRDYKSHKPAKDHPWRRDFLIAKNSVHV